MRMSTKWFTVCSVLLAAACGSKQGTDGTGTGTGGEAVTTTEGYAPLEVGADYASWTKVNTEAFRSPTHGKRMVDVYVNDVGLEAYKSEDGEMPVGSILVKTSWENDADGNPSQSPGPIFVMHKREAGFDPDNEDWWYALHWEQVAPKFQGAMGTQAYWRSPSKKVDYCWECHSNYDRHLGGVPEDKRAW